MREPSYEDSLRVLLLQAADEGRGDAEGTRRAGEGGKSKAEVMNRCLLSESSEDKKLHFQSAACW